MIHQHRKAETDKENFYAKVNFQTTPFSDYNQNNFESQTEMPSCLKDLGKKARQILSFIDSKKTICSPARMKAVLFLHNNRP